MLRLQPARSLPAVIAIVLALSAAAPALAHGPDPFFSGGPMPKDHPFTYRWKAGRVPPTWMQPAIHGGAADSNRSRASRAPSFDYGKTASNWVMYGADAGCGINGIACFTRTVSTTSFTMSFRPQGHRFDWGTLRWCQAYTTWPDGCYDVENVALDEFGHVTGLDHHVNLADQSDYLDAIVQTVSRTKPRAGWNAHEYGRCDVARLQQRYDVPTFATPISTCILLTTSLTLSAPLSVSYGSTATFTARLGIVATSGAYELGDNWLDGRRVVLQRRPIGGTWTDAAVMTPGTNGTYVARLTITTTDDWQAVFPAPAEGLKAATSTTVRVTVNGPCCPL